MIAENTDADSIEDHFKIIGNIMREESPDLMQNFSDFLLNLFDKTLETEYIYKEIDKFTPEDGMSIFTESFKRKEKEDIQKGIRKGIEEGKIESARKMLAEGCDLSFISKITGLSSEKISALKKK